MPRLARQKPVEVDSSDDELPDLPTLLRGSTKKAADRDPTFGSTRTSPWRSSPQRPGTAITRGKHGDPSVGSGLNLSKGLSAVNLCESAITLPPPLSPAERSPVKRSPTKLSPRSKPRGQLWPIKRVAVLADDYEVESSMANSMQQRQKPLKVPHVDSSLLPPSQRSFSGEEVGEQVLNGESRFCSTPDEDLAVHAATKSQGSGVLVPSKTEESYSRFRFEAPEVENGRDQNAPSLRPKRAAKERANHLSRFILKEARCNDGSEGSDIDSDDEEESTDLSGFIVDDNADLSFDGSQSDGSVEFGQAHRALNNKERPARRRLQRRKNEGRRRVESEDEDDAAAGKGDVDIGEVALDLSNLKLSASINDEQGTKKLKVVDLTYSPPKAHPDVKPKSLLIKGKGEEVRPSSRTYSSPEAHSFVDSENGDLLQFSPSPLTSPVKVALTAATTQNIVSRPDPRQADISCTTPPTTPPVSPQKLRSPSKPHLLSPSKRGGAIPVSPHRPSLDAFWSSDVINTWNDQYSPHKPPLSISPNKRGAVRLLNFDIWSDSDNEGANVGKDDSTSSSDVPTPTHGSSPSPSKVPESPSKLTGRSTKTSAEMKKLFLSTRHTTAQSLFTHLDTHVTSGKLSALSASTGGVKILWSKHLRSTAGRANWRRTITKASGSPSTGGGEAPTLTQHYASIELADKVIDSEFRLVNTLAHEFCHLANFMVSGVRDQPHGVSFKAWAERVTTHLRTAPSLPQLYRAVEVTTKHNYAINHKYLWICAGGAPVEPARAAARAFLALEGDPGCGAEYGRHSKSIHPEKHRCGKCKGLLVQIRPQPKMKARRAELDNNGKRPAKGKRPSPTKRHTGSEHRVRDDNDDVRGKSSDNLDGLEEALEHVNLGI